MARVESVWIARAISSTIAFKSAAVPFPWAGSGRAAGVMDRSVTGVAYMDKFAVTPTAQGEGVGAALWQQIRSRYPKLYWRSRADNPVNSWYNKQSDFCIRRGKWQVFGYGVTDMNQVQRLVEDAANRGEYWTDSNAVALPEPSPDSGDAS